MITKLEMALLLASGMSYKKIAEKVKLSPGTIGNYASEIYAEYGVYRNGYCSRVLLMRKLKGLDK